MWNNNNNNNNNNNDNNNNNNNDNNDNNNNFSWYVKNSEVLLGKIGEKGTVKWMRKRIQRSIRRVKREKWKTNGKKNKCRGNMSGT